MNMRLCSIVCLVVMLSASASAQDDASKKEADEFFFQGKRMLQGGKTAAACKAFEASLAKRQQLGVKLNLADCYEQLGRFACASQTFREASELAEQSGDKRAGYARERVEGLVGRVGQLIISATSETTISLDGAFMEARQLGDPIFVDPGPHEIVAMVSSVETFRSKPLVEEGKTVRIEIPILAPPPKPILSPTLNLAPEERSPLAVAPKDPGAGRRVVAYAVGGVGLATVGVGVAASILAVSRKNDSGCSNDGHCPTQAAVDKLSSAQTMGNVATVSFVAGVIALSTGAVLYFTAPKAAEIHLSVGPAASGVWVQGGF